MKKAILLLGLICVISCKDEVRDKIETKNKMVSKMSTLKLDIGLPESYGDTLSLISFMDTDAIDYDKRFLTTDYKNKLDSLYAVIDEELNIIGFEDHFIKDARSGLSQLRQSYAVDQKASALMWDASYGINYRENRLDPEAFKRIEQMIYKRRYEELLLYNYHLRKNLTRSWQDPNTFLFRKRLKDIMPKKVMDSLYPKHVSPIDNSKFVK